MTVHPTWKIFTAFQRCIDKGEWVPIPEPPGFNPHELQPWEPLEEALIELGYLPAEAE